jgi:uncharacterized membrane protein
MKVFANVGASLLLKKNVILPFNNESLMKTYFLDGNFISPMLNVGVSIITQNKKKRKSK